jgi:4-aminobutyrate aminotransferase-like enzyme
MEERPMRCVRLDGTLVEVGGTRKARGCTLTDAQCRRIRDVVAMLLIYGLGMSHPDVVRVFKRKVGTRSLYQVANRLGPLSAPQAIAEIRRIIASA